MRYFDTSFIAPLILQEPTSDRVERFISRLTGDLAISHWTRVEFSSLLAREIRMGGLEPDTAGEADTQFEALVQESFLVLTPSADDFALAKTFVRNYATGLRAGDALHLAIARNNGAEALYSFDQRLIKAGRFVGLPVTSGIRTSG